MRVLWRGLRWVWRIFKWAVGLFLFLLLIQRSTYPTHLQWNAVTLIVRDHVFDYVNWEVNALATKTAQTLWGVHPFMDEADRSQAVRDYMVDLAEARRLEGEVTAMYTNPDISDPDRDSAELRAERDALRDDLKSRQALVEAILEGQVAAVLIDEGFGVLGQLLPPISMHFTQVPNLLIVSPRDEIRFDVSINLDPLPIDEIAALEGQIDAEQDVSSLIVPLGGIALFPAMILETTNISWAIETFAHEWVHHYFFFFPLGLNYFAENFAGEARIINETAADIFGKEIRDLVLARYYPELMSEAGEALTLNTLIGTANLPISTGEPINLPALFAQGEPFDFGVEMNETRVTVDNLMRAIHLLERKADMLETAGDAGTQAEILRAFADGLVMQAENYMEVRRQVFYDNGYAIRKMNQAYFAFYGGYQGGIPGIGGEDLIGPAVRDILAFSPDVHSFIVAMRGITSREGLLALRDDLEISP